MPFAIAPSRSAGPGGPHRRQHPGAVGEGHLLAPRSHEPGGLVGSVYVCGCKDWRLKDHRNMRILHSGSKAPDKWDSRNHGLRDPYVYVVFGP